MLVSIPQTGYVQFFAINPTEHSGLFSEAQAKVHKAFNAVDGIEFETFLMVPARGIESEQDVFAVRMTVAGVVGIDRDVYLHPNGSSRQHFAPVERDRI